MARFVVLTDYLGASVAINPEFVVEFHRRESKQDCVDILLVNSTAADDQTVLTVKGSFGDILALLNGDAERSIDAVHLTGWVLNPDHPDRRYRLHPSILTDDQPPAWAPEKPTNGGAE